MVHPVEKALIAYSSNTIGKFGGNAMYAVGDPLYSTAPNGYIINIDDFFEN